VIKKPLCCSANPRLTESPRNVYVRLDVSTCDLLSAVHVSLALDSKRLIAFMGAIVRLQCGRGLSSFGGFLFISCMNDYKDYYPLVVLTLVSPSVFLSGNECYSQPSQPVSDS